jgi:hypothetical protein
MKTIEIDGVAYQCYDRMNRKIRSAIAKIQMKYRAPEKVNDLKYTHPKREEETDEEYNERIDELFRMNPGMVDFMDEMLCKGYQLIVFAPKMTEDQLMEMNPETSDKILTEIILGHLLQLMDKTSDERVRELTKKVGSVSSANDP